MTPVTQTLSLERLILMPEVEALRAHFDARNCRMLFRWLLFFVMTAMILALVMIASQSYLELIIPAVNLIAVRLLYTLRERPIFSRYFRVFLLGFLVLQILLLKAAFFDLTGSFHPVDFIAPLFLLFFRLSAGEAVIPLGVTWGSSVGHNVVTAALSSEAQLNYGLIIGQSAITVAVFTIVTGVTKKRRQEFLIDYRRELHRHRERRRMQEELDDARRIQLSMLPRQEPKVGWLDVSGISIPASEVGGDYYDYFAHSATRQAVVVGDVAGHGVASGLMLSGVRSCLHLLHETPLEPATVLAKIDRMLRSTAVRRNFVTLLYALFDRDASSLTFSMAGHPPILCMRAGSGEVEEHVIHALPLGTRLGTMPEQQRIEIAPGDVFLFFTDGILETVDRHGEIYGDARLARRLARLGAAGGGRSAKEIRDTLLGDLWAFKADGEQLDDITVVVVKVDEIGVCKEEN